MTVCGVRVDHCCVYSISTLLLPPTKASIHLPIPSSMHAHHAAFRPRNIPLFKPPLARSGSSEISNSHLHFPLLLYPVSPTFFDSFLFLILTPFLLFQCRVLPSGPWKQPPTRDPESLLRELPVLLRRWHPLPWDFLVCALLDIGRFVADISGL